MSFWSLAISLRPRISRPGSRIHLATDWAASKSEIDFLGSKPDRKNFRNVKSGPLRKLGLKCDMFCMFLGTWLTWRNDQTAWLYWWISKQSGANPNFQPFQLHKTSPLFDWVRSVEWHPPTLANENMRQKKAAWNTMFPSWFKKWYGSNMATSLSSSLLIFHVTFLEARLQSRKFSYFENDKHRQTLLTWLS